MKKFFNYTSDENGVLSVYLYGEIGHMEEADPQQVVRELAAIADGKSEVRLHINSYGGDVFAGLAIYEAVKKCKGLSIHVDGVAASMAAVIALCGKPLHMGRYSRLMVHRVSGAVNGSAEDMKQTAGLIEGLETDLAQIVSGRMNMKPEEVKRRYFDGSDHWFTAEEAHAAGLADGITDDAPEGLDGTSTDRSIYDTLNARFKNSGKQAETPFISRLRALPAFSDITNETELFEALRGIKRPTVETRVSDALAKGWITDADAQEIRELCKGDVRAAAKAIERRKARFDEKFDEEYLALMKTFPRAGLIPVQFINGELKELARNNFATFRALCGYTKKMLVSEYIEEDKTGRKTLDYYRKHDPKKLRDNPHLYNELIRHEFGDTDGE